MNPSNDETFFQGNIALFAFGTEYIVENTCSRSEEVARMREQCEKNILIEEM